MTWRSPPCRRAKRSIGSSPASSWPGAAGMGGLGLAAGQSLCEPRASQSLSTGPGAIGRVCCGLSLAEALAAVAPTLTPQLALKWPNDCQLAGAKLAGILLEGTTLPQGHSGVVIGMGVNVRHHPDLPDYPVTSLHAHGVDLEPERVFAALSDRFAANLELFDSGRGFGAIRAGWLRHALPLGTPLRVRLPAGERHGSFAGLDPDGHLLLETGGALEAVMVGDVFLAERLLDPQAAVRTLG